MTGKVGILALLAAAVAGPAAAVVWPSTVKWAVVIAYEIVLVVIGLVGGIFNELKKRWQTRVADRMDQALSRRLSRFEKRYREYVLSSLRFIDLKGLTTIGFYTPDLDEVFVDVSLQYRAPHDIPAGMLAGLPPDADDRHSIWDFLNNKQPVMLAVLGAPGSGKTTLLRHTARRVFESKQRTIPVLLYLRDHVSYIAANSNVTLPALIRHALGSHGETEPPKWFEQKLRDGSCVVLLDGLDEVARQEDRRRVADWVEVQTRRYPDNDYVLTSRPHGYRSAPIDGAAVLQVRSFTDEQVQKFVHGWYLAVERHTTNGTEEEVQLRASTESEDLLERLRESPALADLTMNPLLLTMIANVHRYRGALPGSRAELYSEICQVMLWRRLEAKKLSADLSGDKKETLLRGLAYTMMQRQVRDLETREILEELETGLRRLPRTVSAQDFLADVSSNGLLVERESGQFSFAHHTFQEFLAAGHIREKGLVRTLTENVNDIWWRETTLLYTARSDADAVVEACLESGTVTALSLAFDCAEQDSEIDPELRERLEDLISEAWKAGAEPDRRRLAAAVLVTRHLRQTVVAGSHGRVCATPITNQIYYLFRQDVPGPLPDGPGHFTPDDRTVAGVHWSDTLDFVRWINRLFPDERGYRVPSEDQIAHPAVQRILNAGPRGAWVDSGRPTLWLPRTSDDPHIVGPHTQTGYVANDLRRSSDSIARLFILYAVTASTRLGDPRASALAMALAQTMTQTSHVATMTLSLAAAQDLAYRTEQLRRLNLRARRADESIEEISRLASALRSSRNVSELDRLLGTDHRRLHTEIFSVAHHTGMVGNASAMVGAALSHSVGTSAADASTAAFTREFMNLSRAGEVRYKFELDALVPLVERACRPLIQYGESAWVLRVASDFRDAALPVFTRSERLTPEKATALRITALCLAVEAGVTSRPDTADHFRFIAAGVTLLQRRASGHSPANETIILATA